MSDDKPDAIGLFVFLSLLAIACGKVTIPGMIIHFLTM